MATTSDTPDPDHWSYRIDEGDDRPHGFIQWKGTDVCMDLDCQGCGESLHVDGSFAYRIRCWSCGAFTEPRALVELRLAPEQTEQAGAYVDTWDTVKPPDHALRQLLEALGRHHGGAQAVALAAAELAGPDRIGYELVQRKLRRAEPGGIRSATRLIHDLDGAVVDYGVTEWAQKAAAAADRAADCDLVAVLDQLVSGDLTPGGWPLVVALPPPGEEKPITFPWDGPPPSPTGPDWRTVLLTPEDVGLHRFIRELLEEHHYQPGEPDQAVLRKVRARLLAAGGPTSDTERHRRMLDAIVRADAAEAI